MGAAGRGATQKSRADGAGPFALFSQGGACSDGTRSDRRPRFPAAAFDNERPRPRRMLAPSRATRKKKGRLSDRGMLKSPQTDRALGKPANRKFAGGEICRQGVLPGLDRQKRSPSATCKPGPRPATGFDDPEGPGSSAGGKPTCIHGRFHGRKWPQEAGLLTPEAKFASDFSLSEEFLRSRALPALCGRHRRLASRARDPATGFDDPEGPGGSAGGEPTCIQGSFHGRKWPPEAKSPLIFSVSGRFSYLWACQRSETVCTATV